MKSADGRWMRIAWLHVAVVVVLNALIASASDVKSTDDPVMRALLEEMQRSKAHLKLEQIAAPYYIDYRLLDIDERLAESSFGAVRNIGRSHVRTVRVSVRVGDYRQDSFYEQGKGAVTLAPLDDDILACVSRSGLPPTRLTSPPRKH